MFALIRHGPFIFMGGGGGAVFKSNGTLQNKMHTYMYCGEIQELLVVVSNS